ncbi:MAG: Hsp20/alpha crystallin family protein [Planctomycetota bacterium]|nr:Hsp20/alpha crystallin family protein [Planctomycetota bacterium]
MADQTQAIQQRPPQQVQERGEAQPEHRGRTFTPNVDIIDAGEEFLVLADVPGASRDNIDVTFQEDVLTIDAPVEPRGGQATAIHRAEYGIGGFHRRFVVEAPVDADRMSAGYEDGVLTIHLPKAEKAKGRRIEVKAS